MANDLRFDGRVAIITGAGNGLGRSHALLLASRGARVVVNDLGGSTHGGGRSSAAADKVVQEIKDAGGQAVANYDSVEDGAKIVQCALDSFGRIDIVVNNAGILRDVSFPKMSEEDWELIYRVHVLGAFRVTQAAWPHMRDAGYGRVLLTASAAGIYGNFGQANYSMAKLGLVGLCNTLALEGRKRNILCNTIAPIAGSRMTETVLPKELVEALRPEFVSPLVAYLSHESCQDSGALYEVGGGFVGRLRWERTVGTCFKLARPLTPEAVRERWADINDFSKTTHPTDVQGAMAPVLSNLDSRKSRGSNEFIDVDEALGYEFPKVESSYSERDVALYALGVGAAADPLDQKELQFVYELNGGGFQVLPSFGVVPALGAMFQLLRSGAQAPGLRYGFDRILHGEQYLELKRPLPSAAKLTHKMKVKEIFDKGKNAVVVQALTSYDESGAEVCYNEVTTVVRGAGGFGGDRGPAGESNAAPERAPDVVISEKTHENQALLYRLTGDWNPLHADPTFAQAVGYPRPILHGLCSFGFAVRHVLKAACDNDARRFKSVKARFADSVFPGETLVTEVWRESPTRVLFRAKVKERDKVVISNAALELYAEVPAAKAAPVAAQVAAAPAQAAAAPVAAAPAKAVELNSGHIFAAIGTYVKEHPEVVAKVASVFQWKLKDPESAYVLDLKNGAGSCQPGVADKADCTLELSDSDFMALVAGKADAQKLFFGGKLKLSGNIMLSQKLESVLKGIDREAGLRAAQAAAGPSAAPAAAAPSTAQAAAPMELSSGHIFAAIGAYVKEHPEVVAKVASVFQWKLKDPESAYVLDLKNGAGSCQPGVADKADCTLELSDSDFMALVAGKADAQKLFFGGKLKLSGNIMLSQKLESVLKGIDRNAGLKAAQAAAAPAAPVAKPATKEARSPGLFAALAARLAKEPTLHAEVGALLQFQVKDPERSFVLDLRSAPGSVREGRDAAAAATLTLTEEDLLTLSKDPGQARDLFQRGRLRIDGDIRTGQRLGILKGLV